jgi:hypothetical protein
MAWVGGCSVSTEDCGSRPTACDAYGEGALLTRGRTTGDYNSAAAPYGLQAVTDGSIRTAFVIQSALAYHGSSQGPAFETGLGAVVGDQGPAESFTSPIVAPAGCAFGSNRSGSNRWTGHREHPDHQDVDVFRVVARRACLARGTAAAPICTVIAISLYRMLQGDRFLHRLLGRLT